MRKKYPKNISWDANNIPNVHNVVTAAYMINHLLKQSTGLQTFKKSYKN